VSDGSAMLLRLGLVLLPPGCCGGRRAELEFLGRLVLGSLAGSVTGRLPEAV
jgi:hypothetical protein